MGEDGRIDYVELPGGDLIATKRFYEQAFGWAFTDYGPSYAAFDDTSNVNRSCVSLPTT